MRVWNTNAGWIVCKESLTVKGGVEGEEVEEKCTSSDEGTHVGEMEEKRIARHGMVSERFVL